MNEERKLVLEMLSSGKIKVCEAEKLLDEASEERESESELPKSLSKKFIRIVVKEENNTKVNINIPIALAAVGLKLVPKDALKIDGKIFDVNEILKLVQEGNEGELVNIDSMENGKEVKVKISIE